jgi:hypothetical protein
MGHLSTFLFSAIGPWSTMLRRADFVAKVRNCPVIISRHKTIRPMTADLCGLNHVTEVAREFIVRR